MQLDSRGSQRRVRDTLVVTCGGDCKSLPKAKTSRVDWGLYLCHSEPMRFRGSKIPKSKEKHLFGIVPGMSGSQICLCVAFLLGKQGNTYKQNFQKVSGQPRDNPVNILLMCLLVYCLVFFFGGGGFLALLQGASRFLALFNDFGIQFRFDHTCTCPFHCFRNLCPGCNRKWLDYTLEIALTLLTMVFIPKNYTYTFNSFRITHVIQQLQE